MISNEKWAHILSLSPRQTKLLESLSNHNDSLGKMYLGGLYALIDSSSPDRIAQAAHSFRELMEKAPRYIGGLPRKQKDGYSLKSEVRELQKTWTKMQKGSKCSEQGSGWSGEIDSPLANFLSSLCQFFKDFEENRPTRRQEFANLRERKDPSTEALPEIMESPITKEWVKLNGTFTKICHHQYSPGPPEFEQYVGQLEERLIAVLVPQTVSDHEEIKRQITILEDNVIKREQVKCLLRNHIKRKADHVYFYENISLTDWLDPLFQEGVFNKLPEPVVEGDFVSYPFWPEGQYLLRMARSTTDKATQALIARIIENISNSENQHAEAVRVQVATALPPDITLRFVKKLQKRLSGQELFIGLTWADAIINFALRIAKVGHVTPVLYLLRSLLKVLPDPRPEEEMPLEIPETKVAIDRWRYVQLIEDDLPNFVDMYGPFKVLKIVLCPLLDRAVELNNIGDSDSQPDYSLIWRPVIQESEIHDTSPHQLLTTAVVVTAEQAIQKNPQCVHELVKLLENRRPLRAIFVRIVLHLLTHESEESHGLATDRLSCPKIMSNIELWAEYDNLLRRQFPNLSPEQQDKIVENILAGPRLERENPDTQMLINEDEWILMRLHLISEHLPHEASLHYQALRSKSPDPASLLSKFPPFRTKSWIGPTSPWSLDEMDRLDPRDVIVFLKEWMPKGGWDAPSPEGLSRILAITVKKNAAEYANEAHAFSDLEPTYIKALFYGLTETGQKFPWGPVLQLSRWVVDQSRDYDYADQQMADGQALDRDPDWGWTRKSIAHLLKKGLEHDGQTRIPYDYREDVWYVCEKLLCDPEPTPEYEQQYGGDLYDFTNMAINTVRGTTMHVVMAFVEWSSVNLRGGIDPNNEQGIFDKLTRVHQVLEAHLSIEFDPSLSVRAVYGEWFTRLYQIDKEWASGIIPILFPLERDKQEYFLAAWHSYCLMSRIKVELFELLSDQYKYAIELLKDVPRDRMRSEYKMAGQLAKLFALEEEVPSVKVTIDKFFLFADDHLRSYMVTRMAVGFSDYERKPFMSCVDRLKRFWDQRLATLEESESPNDSQRELEAYGKWFLLDCLSPEWALKQLLRTLRLAKNVADWPAVCERLVNLSHDYPKETTECIRCLAERGDEWFLGRTDNCRKVLSRVMDSGNEEAKELAKEVVDYLVARGFSNYRLIVVSSD